MKKLLLLSLSTIVSISSMFAADGDDVIVTNGKTCTINVLIDRDLGPGVRYTRMRLPEYPLNVNMLRIDVTNQYNSVETTQANDRLYGTESLVKAAARQTSANHVALAGANANFWCVSGQPPYSDILTGLTYNGNVRNGQIISELNMHNDQWNGGYKHTGIVGITTDRKVYSTNNYTWKGTVTSDKTGELEFYTVNKTVRDGELGMYNSYYGPSRTFKCVNQYAGNDGKQHFETVDKVATEVYLTLDEGQVWSTGDPMTFTVKEVKTDAGAGKLNGADMVLVGRGDKATVLALLAAGDKVTMQNGFYNTKGNLVKFYNLVGGNAQVMKSGEMTKYATSEGYNSQVYSRTGYGVDKDKKTLYIIVIDKSTDPVYGASAGCSTTVMCDIAKHFGCDNMTNFDAGGSAEMFVKDAIINKTTEGNPRAVANGMFAYDIAPTDAVVARLAFDDYRLQVPVYGSYRPRVLAYNQYGTLLNEDLDGVELSCPAEGGTCSGNVLNAGGTPGTYALTATYNGVTVTKDIAVVEAPMNIRIKPILIDNIRKYPMEVTATIGTNSYKYDPSRIEWTVSDPAVATIDAEGVLTGKANGTVTVTAKLGEYTDQTDVTVEIAGTKTLPIGLAEQNVADWTTAVTAVKPITLKATGTDGGIHVDYKITGTRGTQFTVKPKKDMAIYSLPESVRLVINPGSTAVFKKVELSLFPANTERPVAVELKEALKANTDNEVIIPMSEFGDATDLAFFPVKFSSIKFTTDNKSGNYAIDIKAIQANYNISEGVDDITTDGAVAADSDNTVHLYNLQGAEVPAASPAPGIYIRRQGAHVSKIIVR